MAFLTFHILGIVSPTDELIFFRGLGQPPTSIYLFIYWRPPSANPSWTLLHIYIVTLYFDVLFENATGTCPASGRFHVSVVVIPGHLKLNMNLCFQESLGNRYKLHLKTTSRGPCSCSANCAFCCERFAIFYNNFGDDLCDLLIKRWGFNFFALVCKVV